ncbi:NEDD8-activating enzyme E1 catalytic subunit [Reticulomyxa filosa]|uniref:NEDD8-activating enzyme E1 catalytic subunit n=1 Tax=Reticulomyxa filosa TaxID=46433 RepID=X6PAM7_RETFI|nr:NEDD8-activating enzyme E1 catalytic subunit [Reticulomyxa filosa]|eukprot:ETO35590.1 NEDD8-activating enzyme E1 catalytic subunit [Reticulomyxa filosa]
MKRVPGCTIKWHRKKLEDFGPAFYKKFDCVIAGLDNVEARRWLNAMLFDLVEFDEDGQIFPETIIPFIDGGTEGFLGQARMFLPRLTACFECSVGTMTPPKAFQSCTIASIPRRPEHCIAYAHKMLWNRLKWFKSVTEYEMETDKNKPDPCGITLDKDDVDHMSWIFNRAMERAKEFNIEGVTYNLTMQVVKNIIPAIASTNALVICSHVFIMFFLLMQKNTIYVLIAACVNECLKALTWCSYGLINYFMYMGQDGVYTRTFEYKPNPQCPVCGSIPILYKLDGDKTTFATLYAKILNDATLKLKDPSISVNGKTIFMAGKTLRALYEENMPKRISSLFTNGDVLQVTDPHCLGKGAAKIKVEFEEGAIYVPPIEE